MFSKAALFLAARSEVCGRDFGNGEEIKGLLNCSVPGEPVEDGGGCASESVDKTYISYSTPIGTNWTVDFQLDQVQCETWAPLLFRFA